MAKPPGTKHSKPNKEPVTIELGPQDITREAGDSTPGQAARPAGGAQAAAAGSGTVQPGPATPKSTGTASPTPPSPPDPEDKPRETAASATKVAATKTEPSKPEPPKTGGTSESKAPTAGPDGPARPGEPGKAAASGGGAVPPRTPPPGGTGGPGGSTPPPGSRPAAPPPAARGANGLLAGVAGGLIALALVAALQWAGVWPGGASPRDSAEVTELRLEVQELRQALAATGPQAEELDGRIAEAVEASAAALGQRIDALEQAAAAPDGEAVDLGPLQARLDELEASIAGLGDGDTPAAAVQEVDGRLADLSQRLEALEASAPDTATGAAEEQLSDVSARLEALEAAGGEAEDLAVRLAAIEEQLAGVVSELGERADEPRAALVLAASSLKAAIERGGGFETELEIYAALAPDAEGVAELGTHAADGVATNAQLIADLPDAADRMLAAGRERAEADGLLDGLWQSARDLVTVRPVGVVEGDSVEAVVARLEAAVRAGDHGRALDEYDALPPAAQAAGADFMDRVRARHQVDTLVDRALSQALRAS